MSNSNTLAREKEKFLDCIFLLKMVNQMKAKDAIEAKILKKGNEPLNEWLQSKQFKMEMIQEAKKGLREIGDKAFELM